MPEQTCNNQPDEHEDLTFGSSRADFTHNNLYIEIMKLPVIDSVQAGSA